VIVFAVVLQAVHAFSFKPTKVSQQHFPCLASWNPIDRLHCSARQYPPTQLYNKALDKQNLLKEEVAELTVGIKEFQTDAFQRLYNKNLRWGSWSTGKKIPASTMNSNTAMQSSLTDAQNVQVPAVIAPVQSDGATLNPMVANANQTKAELVSARLVPTIARNTDEVSTTAGATQPKPARAEATVPPQPSVLTSAERRPSASVQAKLQPPRSSPLDTLTSMFEKAKEALSTAKNKPPISESKPAVRPAPTSPSATTSTTMKSATAEERVEEVSGPAYARKAAELPAKQTAKAPNLGRLFAFGGPAQNTDRKDTSAQRAKPPQGQSTSAAPPPVSAFTPFTATVRKASPVPARDASESAAGGFLKAVENFIGGAGSPVVEISDGNEYFAGMAEEEPGEESEPVRVKAAAKAAPVRAASGKTEPVKMPDKKAPQPGAGGGIFGFLSKSSSVPARSTAAPVTATTSAAMAARSQPRVVAATPPVATAKVSVTPARTASPSPPSDPVSSFFSMFQGKPKSQGEAKLPSNPPMKATGARVAPQVPVTTAPGKPAPAAPSMNAKFRAMVDRVLKGDITKIGTFQKSTDALRAGDVTAKAYLATVRQLFGESMLDTVLTPLISELPERDVANRLKAEWDAYKMPAAQKASASGPLGMFSMLGKSATVSGGTKSVMPVTRTAAPVSTAAPRAPVPRVASVTSPVTAARSPAAPAPKAASVSAPAETRISARASTINGVVVPDQVPIARKQYVAAQMQAVKSGAVDAKAFYTGLVKELGRTKVRVILPALLEQLPRDKAAQVSAEDAAAGKS
jgi:hypothetical protein